MKELRYDTVTPTLCDLLGLLMRSDEFADFRLVGGTSLSLQIGHRFSVDIDLFTDVEYGSVDFLAIDLFLRRNFNYIYTSSSAAEAGFGRSYYVGYSEKDCVKLDLFYTDDFIDPSLICDGVRLATISEIMAMKMDVILRGGRKKDFWDIHEVLNFITLEDMINLHERRYPYIHDRDDLLRQLKCFDIADKDPDPQCYMGKHWELIKLDIIDVVEQL